MAQKWAKWFYNSKEWELKREYIMRRDNYMCQCDKCKGDGDPADEVHHIIWLTPENISVAEISLGDDNLSSRSRDHHFDEHRQYKIRRSKEANRKRKDIGEAYVFDSNGYPVLKPEADNQQTPPIKK